MRDLPLLGDGSHPAGPGPSEVAGLSPLAVAPEYRPRKRTTLLELDMGDGLILYNDESTMVHRLNESAALVWHLSDGTANVRELAEDICAEYGLDRAAVEREVAGLLAELDALSLIEDASHLAEQASRPPRRTP